MINILFKELKQEISLTYATTRFQHGFWHNSNLRVVAAWWMDGYLQPLSEPPERYTRLLLQSGKEHDYCLSFFGLMGMDSKWLWKSAPIVGSIPDQTAICFEDNLTWTLQLTEEEYIVADYLSTLR
jgi:hypothetical protein